MYRCIYLDMKKCASQFCYGFKNFHKLETSPPENLIPQIQDDFLKFEYNSNYYIAGIWSQI